MITRRCNFSQFNRDMIYLTAMIRKLDKRIYKGKPSKEEEKNHGKIGLFTMSNDGTWLFTVTSAFYK